MNPSTDDTVELVPIAELIGLAKVVKAMRQAQRAFFEQRKANPHTPSTAALLAAKDAERRVDAALTKILVRERRPSLPFTDGG